MSIAHLLDDFAPVIDGLPVAMTDVSLEEERLGSFEKGYQAGWDDCVKSQIEDARRITADFAQNLQDLTFTREEMHAALMEVMQPLLRQITGAVLPTLSQETLVPRISEILEDLLREAGQQPITIAAGPDDMTVLNRLKTEQPGLDCDIVEDDTLSGGQMYLRIGQIEQVIDMEDVLQRIEQAVSGFFQDHEKVVA